MLRRILVCCLAVTSCGLSLGQEKSASRRISLPSSKVLDAPSLGRIGPVNSLPATIAISPDHRYAALLNDGYGTQRSQAHQSISILDLSSNELTDFPEQRLPENAHQSYFLGLTFSIDGKRLYASVGSITDPTGKGNGNTGNGIAVYGFRSGRIATERFLKIPLQTLSPGRKPAYGLRNVPTGTAIPYPAGMSTFSRNGKEALLIANNLSDNVIVLDPSDGHVLEHFDLSSHAIVPSSFPYTTVVSKDGSKGWCSLWNRSQVVELDLASGKVARWIPLLEPKNKIAPGSHPTAMSLSQDEKLLYVTLSNADAIAVVDTASGDVVHLASTRLPGQQFAGTYPNALVLTEDGKRLLVADASLNAIAVFDTATLAKPGIVVPPVDEALGFIPTDWYPTAVAVVGDSLLVATAKGEGTGPNSGLSQLKNERRHRDHPYIPTLLYGSLSRINYPAADQGLPALTRKVAETNRLTEDPGKITFQQPGNPIHHVIYILKENRTFDQVFGDLKVGNGDPSLVMYGADITPNQHKLAMQFGVIDNFYDSGEVSGDGHVWSMAAITSDYNEKTWQINYRSHERIYDFGGTVADEFPLENGEPDVDEPATGFIWDNLARHHLTYRVYGEFISAVWCKAVTDWAAPPTEGTPSLLHQKCPRQTVSKGEPLPPNVGQPHGSASPWPWAVPILRSMRPSKAALRDHYDPLYPDFETAYPDQLRTDEFMNEFDGFVRAHNDGKGTELPQFVLLYLPDDHTAGTRPGYPRPTASVADNDLAVGRVVDAVSHSPYWDDTAIFILEDDAQDGADHVDAHRSTALLISKYSPGSAQKPFVDSRFYTTVNMVHTIEALLGLPPMNQNDAYAPVMAPLFTGADQPPFTADYVNRDNGTIYQANTPRSPGAKESAKMDFSHPDAADNKLLNAILWRDRKGDTPMPAPHHTRFSGHADSGELPKRGVSP